MRNLIVKFAIVGAVALFAISVVRGVGHLMDGIRAMKTPNPPTDLRAQ